MMVNVLLIASLVFNVFILFKYDYLKLKKSVPAEAINPDFYQKHPTLLSVADPSQNLFDRVAKIKKQYDYDKQKPDYDYYEPDHVTVKKDWFLYCLKQSRKITNITTRLEQQSLTLHFLNGERPVDEESGPTDAEKAEQDIVNVVDTLNDMSNYYAKFLSNEAYRSIMQLSD